MIELITWVNNSERAGLDLNKKKTTVMSTVDKVNIISDSEDTSTVTNCMYFVVITNGEKNKLEQSSNRKLD
jgi:hypothetical protein